MVLSNELSSISHCASCAAVGHAHSKLSECVGTLHALPRPASEQLPPAAGPPAGSSAGCMLPLQSSWL